MNEYAVVYRIENDLGADEFVDVLARSTLGERRPVNEKARMEAMLRGANLIISARAGDLLIGVSRCLTDFAFCCYCSELAVDKAWHGRGVGQRLLDESVKAAGSFAHFFLLSSPGAIGFYEHIGMRRLDVAFDRPDWERYGWKGASDDA